MKFLRTSSVRVKCNKRHVHVLAISNEWTCHNIALNSPVEKIVGTSFFLTVRALLKLSMKNLDKINSNPTRNSLPPPYKLSLKIKEFSLIRSLYKLN